MSSFELHIDTDNAAFDYPGPEVARILRELADLLDDGVTGHGPLRDVNGNRVGSWEYKGWEPHRPGERTNE